MTTDIVSEAGSVRAQMQTYLDVVVAPREAFSRIEREPTWVVALAAYAVLLAVAAIAQQPSVDHVTLEYLRAKAPQAAAGMTPTPLLTATLTAWGGALVSLLLSTWLYLFAATIAGRGWDFARAWSVAVYSSTIVGITALANSAILVIRGPAAAHHFSDLFAIPALALLTSDARLATALAVFNPLNLWYYLDVVVALSMVMAMPRKVAVATAVVLAVGTAAMYYGIASFYEAL